MKYKKAKISLRTSRFLHEEIERIAKEEGISTDYLISKALSKYMDKIDKAGKK